MIKYSVKHTAFINYYDLSKGHMDVLLKCFEHFSILLEVQIVFTGDFNQVLDTLLDYNIALAKFNFYIYKVLQPYMLEYRLVDIC